MKLNRLGASKFFDENLYAINDFPIAAQQQTIEAVVVYKNTINELPQNEKELLQNILKAIGFSLEKVVLVNVEAGNIKNFAHIKEVFKPKYFIGFGVLRTDIGLNIDLKGYKPTEFNGVSLLVAHKLSDIEGNKKRKLILWKCLKHMFNI
ncbi:MAG: hypothetical protein ACPG5B_10280 [Chitinophagales bacterium]